MTPARSARPARRRGVRNATVAAFFLTSACAAAIGIASPAVAEPTAAEPAELVAANQPDAAFLQALDRAGVGHANDRQAIGTAGNVCQRIRDGFSSAETAHDLQRANPGLEHPHAVAFVKVARTVYCPEVTTGVLPGHPGQE